MGTPIINASQRDSEKVTIYLKKRNMLIIPFLGVYLTSFCANTYVRTYGTYTTVWPDLAKFCEGLFTDRIPIYWSFNYAIGQI